MCISLLDVKLLAEKRALLFLVVELSTLSPNVVIAAGSDDYHSGVATPLVPEEFKGNVQRGNIKINEHCIVGFATQQYSLM